MKLLLIEDESTLAQTIMEYLREEGYSIEYAPDYYVYQ